MYQMNEKQAAQAVALRHEIHANPDLSNQERGTIDRIRGFLQEHTHLEIHDMGAWMYAVYRSGNLGPGVAFRCELDALPVEDRIDAPYRSTRPGVGHKCGHDGHCATMAAFALDLEANGAPVDAYLLFQHAEEIGDGGLACVPLVEENPVAAIYAYHNRPGLETGAVQLMDGTVFCGSKGLTLHFEGVPSHASMPECGKNPAFAISELVGQLDALTAPEDGQGLVLCTVIQIDVGEPAFGTQASRGDLRLTIRGDRQEAQDALQNKLEQLAARLARRDGLTLTIQESDVFPATVNDPGCTDRVRAACRSQGVPCREVLRPDPSSDDYGHLTSRVPGTIFEIGGGLDCPPIHTESFDFPDQILPQAVALFRTILESYGGKPAEEEAQATC